MSHGAVSIGCYAACSWRSVSPAAGVAVLWAERLKQPGTRIKILIILKARRLYLSGPLIAQVPRYVCVPQQTNTVARSVGSDSFQPKHDVKSLYKKTEPNHNFSGNSC